MRNDFGREPRRGGFLRKVKIWGSVTLALVLGYLGWVKFEPSRPVVVLTMPPLEYVGREARIGLHATDRGSGIAEIRAWIEAKGARHELLAERYPAVDWRGSRVHDKMYMIEVNPREAKIPEGPATFVVEATDGSWLRWISSRAGGIRQEVTVDTTPPIVEVLTGQHYMRLGGSDMVVYRASKDATRTGVQVESYFFEGHKGLFADPDVAVCLFAVPQDLTTDARPKVVAHDAAGNRRDVDFYVSVKPRRFQDRTLEIDDAFLKRKVPDLLDLNGLPPTDDLVAGYLTVNRDLRKTSEETIRKMTAATEPRRLWSEVFMRQPDSAPLSSFADRRTYTHGGEKIDSQTHLGFDLASLRLADVPAANDGKIVFADNLGIYGNTVIIDHGLGLFSLYGHLSSIAVTVEQRVSRGDTIGKTGESGLAGGDHLHFSMMVNGIHVDPVEWWDPKWVADHVVEKMRAFEAPGSPAAGPAAAAGGRGR